MSSPTTPTTLTQALHAGDQEAFARLLLTAEVGIVTVDGPDGPRPQVVIDDQERRTVLVFTSAQTAQLWDAPITLGAVRGADLPGLVADTGAESIEFDPAGPAAVSVGVVTVREMLDGIVGIAGGAKLTGDLLVRFDASMHQVFRAGRGRLELAPEAEVYVVTRETGAGRGVTTLFTDDTAAAARLRRTVPKVALPGQPVDIVVAVEPTLSYLRREFAHARV